MAITIDATVGGETSNSYQTLVEFDAYLEIKPFTSEIQALDDEVKKSIMVYATKMIDNMLLADGTITSETQALDFPREDVTDCQGREYNNDEIPDDIKSAQAEQAIYLYTTNPTEKLALLTKGFKRAKADVLEVETDITMQPDMLSSQAIIYLECYGRINPATFAGVTIGTTYRV